MRRSLLLSLVSALAACSSTAGGRALYAPSSAGPSGGAPPLAGGETDDNARLPEYLAYVAAYPHRDVPKLDLTDRRVLTLVDVQGQPLWDVGLSVYDESRGAVYKARTEATGRFLLPPAALDLDRGARLSLIVETGEQDVQQAATVPTGSDTVLVPGARRRHPDRLAVDVALVVDTTGSMADEVERLRSTLQSVVARLTSHPSMPFVRVGGVLYRDVGDVYVTRPFGFSADMAGIQHALDAVQVGGGGDGPEAVQEALDLAVHGLTWGGPGTLRLLFLIGDAPPHFERGTPYTVTMRSAVERGIVIVPVACSGLNDTGEFVFRQLAAVTLGRFLFVSYAGGTEHHTATFEHNDLDLLMARTVTEALDAAWGRSTGGPTTVVSTPYGPTLAPMDATRRTGYGRSPWDFGTPGWGR